MIQRLALWFAFNVRVSKLFALYQSFRHALVNQLLLRADPCGSLVQLIDWLVGPQKSFFTCLNQFNLGHASTQSCELPKRPILHIKIERCCTAHLQKNKTTALRKKKAQRFCGGLSPLSPSWIGKKGWPKPASDFADSTTQNTSTTTLLEFIGDSWRFSTS